MSATVKPPGIASRLVNGILSVKPLADLAKNRARSMMIRRAEAIGVPWRENVASLHSHDWRGELKQVQSLSTYPDYYLSSFHAYDQGNLCWEAALEVESAAHAVHATIWADAGAQGDSQLRQSYHNVLTPMPLPPRNILDLGCSVGMSTFALQAVYPEAQVTGLDLSPHFLAVARYRSRERQAQINWIHAAAESTGLADASFDLVSACLLFHELPQLVAQAVFREARRLLRPGGYFAMMDMNPQAEAYKKMPPYILTLLKSTEPYLDQYFSLDLEQALVAAGFDSPTVTCNSPRHRTVIAQVSSASV
ncbi:MAG: class I SAM-dependent methyltransferase [Cyanophyceae cyanobacterium]